MTQMSTKSRASILIVDDDTEHATTLQRLLLRERFECGVAFDAASALTSLEHRTWDIVLTDLVMPGDSGLDLLRSHQRLGAPSQVVLMTAFGTVELAVEAMRAGAADFIVKPIKRVNLLRTLENTLERGRLREENRGLREHLDRLQGADPVIGTAASFLAALRTVRAAASSRATILLLGESGCGKEVFARQIHATSGRRTGAFFSLHCASLPPGLIESELFGHEAGAFTGATRQKVGYFEAAAGGTIFLDEIGELSPAVQVKLLRVLQENEIQRVGSTKPIAVDVRVVAATHRNLEEMVRNGEFRADLYYRLNVIQVRIPSLRERIEDVELLARHFLLRYRRPDGSWIRGISGDVLRVLNAHSWPGNVRELENVIERAAALDTDGWLGTDDLPESLGTADVPQVLTLQLGTPMAEIERQVILATLRSTGGDKTLAASILGLGRRTIYRKLAEYGDSAEDPGEDPDAPPLNPNPDTK